MTHSIEQLRSQVAEARQRWDKAQEALREALIAGYKWEVGDVIVSTKGEQAKITDVYVKYLDTVYVTAVLKKKSGEWGIRPVSMWRAEWKDATLIEAEGDA